MYFFILNKKYKETIQGYRIKRLWRVKKRKNNKTIEEDTNICNNKSMEGYKRWHWYRYFLISLNFLFSCYCYVLLLCFLVVIIILTAFKSRWLATGCLQVSLMVGLLVVVDMFSLLIYLAKNSSKWLVLMRFFINCFNLRPAACFASVPGFFCKFTSFQGHCKSACNDKNSVY